MEQSQSYDDEEQRTAARQRFFDYYLHTATEPGQLLRPARHSIDLPQAVAGVMRERLVDRSDALTWFTREYSVLLAIMGRQVDDFDRHTWQLAQALLGFLSIRGYWRDNALAQEAGLMAAKRLRDQSGQAYAHRSLSRALILLGRLEEAEHHNQVAMLLSQQLGSKLAVAEVELIFAAIAERRGDLMQALDRAECAYRIYQTADQLPGQATRGQRGRLVLRPAWQLPHGFGSLRRCAGHLYQD
jgi:hypothetical protein